MISLIKRLFFDHWQRKGISIVLACIIWLMVSHSLTSTRTFSNVAVKVMNIPHGRTIEGLQPDGFLSKKISLTLSGNKNLLEDLSPTDIEVLLDATGKSDQWVAALSRQNLVSLNPEIDLVRGITKVSHQSFLIRMTKLITEKIPLVITQPIGESPRGYQFLDIWPYHLMLTVSGPEEVVKRLKAKGPRKLTFNLNNISKTQLDSLELSNSTKQDEVSFLVPESWKQVLLPILSDDPIDIDDPDARGLRIDFIRNSLMPLHKPLPVSLYCPPQFRTALLPEGCSIEESSLIKKLEGQPVLTGPLYAKGVNRLFLEIVQEMIQLVVIVVPKTERSTLEWSVQFINPSLLEDRYVAARIADNSSEETKDLNSTLREEYLRNQFRSYMKHFGLYRADNTKLELAPQLHDTHVVIDEKDRSS
jgi:hypothetical protein